MKNNDGFHIFDKKMSRTIEIEEIFRGIDMGKKHDIVSLIKKLCKKFGVEESVIKNLLFNLLKEKLLTKDEEDKISFNILLNPTRKKIYSLIQKNPGTSLHGIRSYLNIGSNQIKYHLGILLTFKQIQMLKLKNIMVFGDMGTSPNEMKLGMLVSNKNIYRILLSIATESTPVSLTTILNAVDGSEETVKYNLAKLLTHAIISGNEKGYSINPRYSSCIKNALYRYEKPFNNDDDDDDDEFPDEMKLGLVVFNDYIYQILRGIAIESSPVPLTTILNALDGNEESVKYNISKLITHSIISGNEEGYSIHPSYASCIKDILYKYESPFNND